MPSKARRLLEQAYFWKCTERYVNEVQYRQWHSRMLWEYSSQEDVLSTPPWVLHLLSSLQAVGQPSEPIWLNMLQEKSTVDDLWHLVRRRAVGVIFEEGGRGVDRSPHTLRDYPLEHLHDDLRKWGLWWVLLLLLLFGSW